MRFLLEREVVNTPFAFLSSLIVQHTKLCTPLSIQDTLETSLTVYYGEPICEWASTVATILWVIRYTVSCGTIREWASNLQCICVDFITPLDEFVDDESNVEWASIFIKILWVIMNAIN